MVGLMDLGEAAWEVERAMNQWLEAKKPASASLLDLVTIASKSFSGWIAALKEGALKEEVDASHLVDLVAHLNDEPAAPAAPAPSEDTTIGGVTMPRNFFDIYHKEASGHVAALEAQCREWRQMPGAEASHEFMRAAHTLASSSRTAGFPALADLAAVLEHWTGFSARTTAAADGDVIQAAIAKLRWMVEGLAKKQAPAADEETVRKLRALIARIEAQPVPVVESKVQPPLEPKQPKAEEKKPAEKTGREKRVMRDDIDPQLLPIFLEEAQQLVPQLGADLRDWKANPADAKVSDSLRRVLHTFKGSARMAGAIRLGELCHMMESKVEEALEKNAYPKALWDELEDKMDRLSLDVERMETGAPEEDEVAPAAPAAVAAAPIAKPAAPARPHVEPQRPAAPLPSPAATLRVNAETLDYLINESGEVAIARSRVEAELRIVKQALSDLNDSIARTRGQLREAELQADSQMQSRLSVAGEKDREFDPLEFDRYTRLQELTRMMAEGLSDITSIQQALLKNVGDTDAALLQQARTSREVQQQLMRIRAVPFSNLNERLYRIVRQTARELDKKADLHIEGSEVELDRSVLERIGAPLEHMLRNALAHGLESPEARLAAGKPDTGKIAISLRQESNEIALVLSDDGAGLDLEKLRRKAQAMGLLAEGEPSEAQLTQLIFVSGLSTADSVSELAGRGVGMDVVRNEITAIGGRIEIATTHGQGTTFAIHLPLTLAVTQVVLVRAGSTVVAISSAMVEQVLRMKEEALAEVYGRQSVAFQDRVYPLRSLSNLLGSPGTSDAQAYNSVLLLRSGIQRLALHVDELIGNEEIVVKNIGPQVARLPGVAGATVLADGAIVLIMNPVQMAAAARARTAAVVELPQAAAPVVSPAVMVVDDSLTVRRITSRLLEREGYRVLLAKDGVDALEQMKDALPGVLLVDIEMPRMDGFDLTRNVRADARLQGIPIIIISSRTAEKHRNRAAELGVNAFLGKPYQESELLQHIAQHLRA